MQSHFLDGDELRHVEVHKLRCDHNEADTRLIFHALYAAKIFTAHNLEDTVVRRIIVASEDTDTTVIAVRHASEIAAKLSISVQDAASVDSNVKFCVQCGIAELELLDIFQIANSLGADLCLALPGMHALTGCDTVSFFKTKGKTLAWKIFLENHPRFTDAFKALGETVTESLSEVSLLSLEAFICRLYQSKTPLLENVTDVREKLFVTSTTLTTDEKLPPAQVCLKQHLLRAQYQTFQWCNCRSGIFDLPSPTEFGFKEVDSKLKVNWFDGDMLPPSLHTRVSCGCQTGSLRVAKMWLSKSGTTLQCNENCKCQGCSNCGDHATEDGEDDDEEDAGKSGSDSSAD